MSEPEQMTPETFEEHVGTEFTVTAGEKSARLELVSVDRLGDGPEGHRDPFSLKFEGDADVLVHQQTHSISHEGLGDLEMFLVPLGPGPGVMRYEAIFG